jgi:hypothetical protein
VAETLNTQIADAMTVQHLTARREEARLRAWLAAQLGTLGTALARALRADDPTAGRLLGTRQQDVEDFMTAVGAVLIQDAFQRIAAHTERTLVHLAGEEAHATQTTLADLTDGAVVLAAVAPARLEALLASSLFPTPQRPGDPSATLGTWWERQAQRFEQQVHDALLVGVTQEASLRDVTMQIQGTEERGRADGLVAAAIGNASILLRTATTNMLAETRSALAAANPGSLDALEHGSVLDSRTSEICLARDGLRYTVDTHEPLGHSIPYAGGIPYHFNALAGGTLILTSEGLRDIADIVPGDSVMTHRGRWRRVMQAMYKRNETGIIRRINTNTGRILLATDEHPIMTLAHGWQRAADLEVGDQCCEYPFHTMQIHASRMFETTDHLMPNESPAFLNQHRGSNDIMSMPRFSEMGQSINFQGHLHGGKSKVQDINTEGILENHAARLTSWPCLQNALFGRGRMLTQIAGPPGHHTCHYCIICRRIGDAHPLAMFCKKRVRLFPASMRPMLLPSWLLRSPLCGLLIDSQTIELTPEEYPMPLAPVNQQTCRDAMSFFNSTQGTTLFPMLSLNQILDNCLVSQIDHSQMPSWFNISSIISIDEISHHDFVYDLSIEEDESYVANGILVHNCRSQWTFVVDGGGAVAGGRVQTFLQRQTEAMQNKLLGRARAAQWRAGKLTPQHLLDAVTG